MAKAATRRPRDGATTGGGATIIIIMRMDRDALARPGEKCVIKHVLTRVVVRASSLTTH